MKTLRISVSIFFAAILLLSSRVYGQKKDDFDVLTPQKGLNAKEKAAELTKEGWKTNLYSIEEQLASTWKLMCEMRENGNDRRYFWAQSESSASNFSDAMEKNHISCTQDLTYQVELPFLSQCRLIACKKKFSEEQIATIEKVVLHITPMVVSNHSRPSFEIFNQKDKKLVMVKSIYVVDTTGIYDIILKECIKFLGDNEKNAPLIDVFQEAIKRMENKKLR